MNKSITYLVVGLLVVIGGYYLSKNINQTPVVEDQIDINQIENSTKMEESSTSTESATVKYADTGFSPKSITVKIGTSVKFINETTKSMWVASALHPTHEIYPEFDQLKSVAKDGMYEFTFTKVGSWKYHNHVSSTDTGVVEVTE